MVLTKTFINSFNSTAGSGWPLRRAAVAGVTILLGAFLQPVMAVDETAPPGSSATQAIWEQLQKRIAEQTAAAQETQLRATAAADVQSRIEKLKTDLEIAVQQLATHKEAQKLAATSESNAEQAVALLASQLESHRAADALQATADAALNQLEARRAEVVPMNDQLAGLQKESLNAEQEARRADRQADDFAGHAQETRQMLPTANQAVSEAKIVLEEAQTQSIQATRALAEWQRLLSQALLNTTRVRSSSDRLTNTVTAIENAITAMRNAADVSAGNSTDQIIRLREVVNQIIPMQSRAEQILDARLAVVVERQEQQVAATVAAATSESVRRMKADAYSVLSGQHFALQREVVRLEAASEQKRTSAREFSAKKEQLESAITQMQGKTEELAAVVNELHGVWVGLQSQAEQAQKPLGRFVSFSRDIAPILASRCTACHNSRTTGGRLNLNSFAALMKGGDSGVLLTPHDAEGSLLLTMVQDGSMPQDAESLSMDQIEMIRRWIDVGAPLDARSTATADLFDIMPELPQPLPPATYRVPVPVLAIAFSPNGSLLATSGYHEVLLWGSDGGLVRRITNVAQRVNDLAFTADSAMLVVAAGTPGQLGEVKLFRVVDGVHLGTPVRTTDSIYAVSVSPDGTRLAAGGADRRIVIADMDTQRILRTIEDHADSVMDVAWSSQSDRIVSASHDKSCRIFDAATGEAQKSFTQHGEPVYTVAFLPDGESIVSGGADKKLRVWPVADGEQIREIQGFDDHVFRLVVTGDGRVYSAGADRQVREHQVSNGELLRTMTGHADWVYALSVDAKGTRLATGCYDGEVRLWNSTDGTMVSSFVAIPQQDGASVTVSGH